MENPTVQAVAVARFVTELLEAWNAHDPDRVAALYAQTYEGTDVGEAGPLRGPEAVRVMVARYLRAFPDLKFTQEEMIVQVSFHLADPPAAGFI